MRRERAFDIFASELLPNLCWSISWSIPEINGVTFKTFYTRQRKKRAPKPKPKEEACPRKAEARKFASYKNQYVNGEKLAMCACVWGSWPTRLLKYKSHCQQWPAALTCDDRRRTTDDNWQRITNREHRASSVEHRAEKVEHVDGWQIDGGLMGSRSSSRSRTRKEHDRNGSAE